MPVCRKCKREKPETEFYMAFNKKLKTECKDCSKEYARQRQQKTYQRKILKGMWNFTATMCWERKCVCKGCNFENFFSEERQKCKMYKAVEKLYKKHGEPPKELEMY